MTSLQKAEKFAELAKEYGWDGAVTGGEDDRYDLELARGDERIFMWWQSNSMTEAPKYRYGAYECILRNASAVKKQLDQPPKQGTVRRRKVVTDLEIDVANIEVDTTYLPFDPEESPNKEILKAVRGNTVQWINSVGGFVESGHIPKFRNMDLTKFKITKNLEGRRILHFISEESAGVAFRSVYVDRIARVG